MLTNIISAIALYKPQNISAQPANTGTTSDLVGALKKEIKDLGYSDDTVSSFTKEVMGWKDASGRPLMQGWMETLSKARNDNRSGRLGMNDLVKLETKVITELGNEIKTEFSFNEQAIDLGKALSSRHAQRTTYAEMIYVAAAALGFPVQGAEASKISVKYHYANKMAVTLISTSDKQVVLADLATEPVISISAPFSLEASFEKDGNVLALKPKAKVKDDVRIYSRLRTLDLSCLSAMRLIDHGNAYLMSGDVEWAIADLNKAISLDPNSTLAHNGLGNIYFRKGQFEDAVANYSKAISLDPKDILAYCNRGRAYMKMEKNELGIADFTAAISIEPGSILAYIDRGNAYIDLKKYQQALVDGKAAVKIDPKNAMALYNLGRGCVNLGLANKDMDQIEEGIETLKKAGKLNPDLMPEINKLFDYLRSNVMSFQ